MKTRIISGAVALVLLAGLIALHSTVIFNIGFGLIGALMVYEILRAEKLDKEYAILIPGLLFAFISPVAVFFTDIIIPDGETGLRDIALLYIIAAFAYIVTVTAILLWRHKNIKTGPFSLSTYYALLITACMSSLCGTVKLAGNAAVCCLIFTFMGSWVADSGAYFAGTFFGKHKLCPEISPKKTVEGLIGGAITNGIAFAAFAFGANAILGDEIFSPIIFALLGIVCCFLGLLGDLTASLIKRECGIKDYGNIMPGHGGAMDRFDSVIYVAPFMLAVFSQITNN